MLFDAAATVLDQATCRADVRYALIDPPYSLRVVTRSDWHILVGSATMIKFRLREDLSAQTAEVDILP